MRLAAVAVLAALAVTPLPARAATTYQLVSTARGPGAPATYYPHTAISGNGRYVAFKVSYSDASPDPLNPPAVGSPTTTELWYADLVTRKQVKVMTGYCCIDAISLSRDGRYLVFESYEKTLVPNDKNERTDVFYWDAKTGKISRIVGVAGQELNQGAMGGVIAPDGNTIVYVSSSDVLNKRNQQAPPCTIYKYSLRTRKTTPVVIGGKAICAFPAGEIAVSTDARYLAITTMDQYAREDASALDVYWVDTVGKRFALMSETATASTNGSNENNENPTISGNGRLVGFVSGTITPFSLRIDRTVLLRDVQTGRFIDVSTGLTSAGALATEDPRLSEDGNWLTFLDNHGEVPLAGHADQHAVYVRDLRKDITSTERIEPLGSASQNAVPSANGKVIVYITNESHDGDSDNGAFDVYVARR